jgi:predicted RNA-binding protein with EMAP domain
MNSGSSHKNQNQNQPYSAELYKGMRYNSSSDLAFRLISGLAQYCYSYLQSEELVEMHLISVLKTLTYEEKQYLVIEAARDCAGADHWYTFEKDWG